MERHEAILTLNGMLLEERPEYRGEAARFSPDTQSQRNLLRSLMNLRAPAPLADAYLAIQDELLQAERAEKGIVDAMELQRIPGENISLWQGDITRLKVDAIVNAANSALLGCFCPCHACIDNAIHSAAGLQLREECDKIMRAQKHEEPTGSVKVTSAYNLPSRYVMHTVGPIVRGSLTDHHRQSLRDCYGACLAAARDRDLESLAFCCISTGEFHFPPQIAAEIAVRTVRDLLGDSPSLKLVVFNVFKDSDLAIYRSLLHA